MGPPRIEPSPGEGGSSEGKSAVRPNATFDARPGETQVAFAIAAIVGAVFIWWAWKQGAYFGSVFLPGSIVLYALLILLLIGAPLNARLTGPARVALAAIVALAAWTLLSIVWTNNHDAAVQNAERGMLYATAFAIGLWTSNLAGRRLLIPLAPVAVTGAVIGIVTTVTLASGTDVVSYVHSDATLRFPIGYRNADAAFLLICLFPTIALAAEGDLPWPGRALTIGAATMLLELAVLSESRGSLPAAAVGLTIFVALTPRRLRAVTYLGLAAIPVLPALPALLDVFQYGHGGSGLLPLLRDSARAIALTTLGSVALAAFCIRGVESRLDLGPQRVRLISRILAVVGIVVVVGGGAVFVAERGGPFKFIDQRVSEFNRVGYPNLQEQGTRFGANVGSNRHDFWRVALDEGRDHPLLGGGAGSFAAAYLADRKSDETPRDPHSVEMLMFSELGLVGLLLLATFVVAAALAGIGSWRLGPGAAALVAGSFGAGSYWLVHSSYDWFWLYPGVTAPAIFLLGAAAAPRLFDRAAKRAEPARYGAAAALALALLLAVPLFLSQRYENQAYDDFPQDPQAALDDLDRAASLDPYDPEPLLTKGVIESRLGRDQDAISAFRDAAGRRPASYAAHFFLARALAPTDLTAARAEADEALRLNPLDLRTRTLNRRLERQRGP